MPFLGPADNDTTINFGLTATINEWYILSDRSEGQGIDWRAVYGPMKGAHPERFFDSISNGTLTQEELEQRRLQNIADLALKRVEEMERNATGPLGTGQVYSDFNAYRAPAGQLYGHSVPLCDGSPEALARAAVGRGHRGSSRSGRGRGGRRRGQRGS